MIGAISVTLLQLEFQAHRIEDAVQFVKFDGKNKLQRYSIVRDS